MGWTFIKNYVNSIFNNFLNIYLRYYHSSFIKNEAKQQHNNKWWLSKGIRIFCNRKKELYLLRRDNNNPILKKFYKNYCKTLLKVISAAKHMYYNEVIRNSENKIKKYLENH